MNGINFLLGQSSVIPIGLTIAMGIAIAVGLVLWLIGRSIAKPSCVISGLVLGGIGGLIAATIWQLQGLMILPLIIGFALAGALLSGLLFRLWMGLSGAILLAFLGPLCMFVWQGADVTILQEKQEQTTEESTSLSSLLSGKSISKTDNKLEETTDTEPAHDQLTTLVSGVVEGIQKQITEEATPEEQAKWGKNLDKSSKPVSVTLTNTETAEGTEAESQTDAVSAVMQSDMAQKFFEAMNSMRDRVKDQLQVWWEVRTPQEQTSIMVASLAGALIGLLFGLIAPYWAASFESALVGAILMLLPGMNLAEVYIPAVEPYLPNSPRSILVFLGLITIIGVLIQWTIFRKSADK
ncbi:hypothetical protein JD969_20705 [Planctomycetota bacterium]|nr:hypothetical protein JD969_20705 [Planctomycetota bacterium]